MLISDLLEVKEEGEELNDAQEKHQYFITGRIFYTGDLCVFSLWKEFFKAF